MWQLMVMELRGNTRNVLCIVPEREDKLVMVEIMMPMHE